MKYQRVVLVPANLDRKVTITGDRASEDYIRSFARTITNLAFNYTPASVRGQYGELLTYFSSDSFPAAKEAFYSLADTVERTRLSSQFVITKAIDVDNDKGVMVVTGAQKQWVENSFVDTSEKIYIVNYKILDGRFVVTSISENKNDHSVLAKGPARPAPAQAPATGGNTNVK